MLRNNAPPELLEETGEKISRFLIAHAQANPSLHAEFHLVEKISEQVYRITISVRNDGHLPTNITQLAVNLKQAKPIVARIHLGEDDVLLVGDVRQEIGQLDGYGGGGRIDRPAEGIRRKKVEWMVRFAGETAAKIEVSSQKAGVVRLDFVMPLNTGIQGTS